MNKQKEQDMSALCARHLRLTRSMHVAMVLAEANSRDSEDLLYLTDAVYDEYNPLLQQIEAEYETAQNEN